MVDEKTEALAGLLHQIRLHDGYACISDGTCAGGPTEDDYGYAMDVLDLTHDTAERDQARGIAVTLENRIEAALALHPDNGWGFCEECYRTINMHTKWPCPTRRALDGEP